jgi:hypothetical protein
MLRSSVANEQVMAKRNLRVIKWLGTVPAVASCTACNKEFKISVDSAKRLADAQESLQQQFAAHTCGRDGSGASPQN